MTVLAAASSQGQLATQLEKGIIELGLDVADEARGKLLAYLELLERWNRIHNLTSVRDMARAVSVHLLDSLSVVPHVVGARVLDAGSGAGFPGIPVAVAKPDVQVDLLDGNQKKCAFLRQAVAEVRLQNAKVVCERIESWHPEWQYDFILSRALADLAEVVELCAHLLSPRGVIAAMKGVHPYEEIERISPKFRVRQVHVLAVPGLGAERHLVLVERA